MTDGFPRSTICAKQKYYTMNVVRIAWVIISDGLKRWDSVMVLLSRCSPTTYDSSEFRVNNDTNINRIHRSDLFLYASILPVAPLDVVSDKANLFDSPFSCEINAGNSSNRESSLNVTSIGCTFLHRLNSSIFPFLPACWTSRSASSTRSKPTNPRNRRGDMRNAPQIANKAEYCQKELEY